jgi:hypothetical protein
MQLDHLQFEPRPRGHWEALDLGTLLARRWYSRLLVLWLLPATVVFLLVFALLPSYPGTAMFICWWLKPVYERAPLKYLSRAVFADEPTFPESLRDGWRAVRPGMLAVLTVRRLSAVRSFVAPVYVLEGATGQARRRRLSVLQPRAGSAALWLTVLGVHVEAFLVFAMLALAFLLVPSSLEVDWLDLLVAADQESFAWMLNLGSFAAMALVAPFYVSGGFALYLNRRVELEAWDVELGFRRLARRLAAPATALLCVLVMLPFDATQAAAAPAPATVPTTLRSPGLEPTEPSAALDPERAGSRRAIAEVLAAPDFHQQRTVRYPAFLEDLFEGGSDEAPADLGWLVSAFRWVARGVEAGLWVLLVLGLVWLIRRVRWSAPTSGLTAGRGGVEPLVIDGVPVVEGSLPRGLPASAEALWRSDRQREAVALIYRAALGRLGSRFGCVFAPSDTESDCIAKAGSVPAETRAYFEELSRVWTALAYAHRPPDATTFEALVRRWAVVMDGAPDAR